MKLLKSKNMQYIVFGLVLALAPLIFGLNRGTMTMLNTVIIYGIIAIGFNILLGYAGQISLGHGAFMGLGAYVSAYITSNLTLPLIFSRVMALAFSLTADSVSRISKIRSPAATPRDIIFIM